MGEAMPSLNWRRLGRMSHAEYRANLNGLNIFFGAVLGVVMAGTETLAPHDFAVTLFFAATLVISILHVSSSRHRIAYAATCALLIAFLPRIIERLTDGASAPSHLQPTLAVWLAITIIVELLPREREGAEESAAD